VPLEEIKKEIQQHDLSTFTPLSADTEEFQLAKEYLLSMGLKPMAIHLESLITDQKVLTGPVRGFLAAAVDMEGQTYIIISDQYPDYNCTFERVINLIHEIGATSKFGQTGKKNDAYARNAAKWLFQKDVYPLHQAEPEREAPQPVNQEGSGNSPESTTDAEATVIETDGEDEPSTAKHAPNDPHDRTAPISDAIENIDKEQIDHALLSCLRYKQVNQYQVFPLRIEQGTLILAAAQKLDLMALDDLQAITEKPVRTVLCPAEEVKDCIQKFYTGRKAESSGLIDAFEDMDIQSDADEHETAEDLIEEMETVEGDSLGNKEQEEFFDLPPALKPLLNDEMPTVKLVNLIISDAVKVKSSDIHIEPREKLIEIRYRIDGDLTKIMSIPIKFHARMLSRIKILAKLDIAMVGSPQDGRIQLTINKNKIDFRVSIIPTFHGEKAVIRILDANEAKTDLDILGFQKEEEKLFCDAIKSPQGMVFVTGPTGSGKTSTLYAALNYIKNETLNIITVEDPIEFLNEGINQVQINPSRGVTFASALRSILRQDPNVILVGEIRDKETADIAVKASLTGHLLLSTLHTNGTIETITRLADIGLDYYQISSALILVLSQRLVKRICENCKEEYTPDPILKEKFQEQINALNIKTFYRGKGCAQCNYKGYKGRAAVFEVLKISDNLKALISQAASFDEMLKEAKKSGLKQLVESGMQRVADGVTTLDEIIKHLGTLEQKHAHHAAAQKSGSDGTAVATEDNESKEKRATPKILIVDDEEGILKVLDKIVTTAGYDVIKARNGQECIEKAFRTRPDLIITDLMMPVMDGYAAVKQLRSQLETAIIPIMMLSAKQDKESEIKGINFGADEYLPKPIDKEKLLARIKMLLRRRG
jgi:type IV pilus assembly protein PilB